MTEDIRSRKGTPGSANPNECYTCLGPVDHWHHVVPYSMGGDITLPLCDNCHSKIHDKDLLSMQQLAQLGRKKRAIQGKHQGSVSKFAPLYGERIEKLYKDGLSAHAIANLFITENIWVMPKDYQGRTVFNTPKNKRTYAYFHSAETIFSKAMAQRVRSILRSMQTNRELAEIKFWYELRLKPEGERCAWVPDFEPVTRGSNLPSLFTETLQPAFDLKTTATSGSCDLSQWAWDAEQDT